MAKVFITILGILNKVAVAKNEVLSILIGKTKLVSILNRFVLKDYWPIGSC